MKLLFAAAFAGAALSAGAAAAQPLPDFPQGARPGECYARVPMGGPAPLAAGGGGQRVWTVEKGAGPGAVWRFDQRPGGPAPGPIASLGWAVVDCATGRPIAPVQHAAPALPPGPPPGPPPGDVLAEAPPPPPPVMVAPGGGREPHVIIRPRPGMHAQPHLQPMPPFAEVPGPHGPGQPPVTGFEPRGPLPPHGPQYAAPPAFGPGPHPMGPPMPPMAQHGGAFHGPQHGFQYGSMHGPQYGPMHAPPPLTHPGGFPPPPMAHHGGPEFGPPPQPFVFPPAPETYAQAPAEPRWFGDRFLTWPGKR